mgnify:CR=1 FL=1
MADRHLSTHIYFDRHFGCMAARVLPGGADYQLIVGDTVAQLEAHYVLETDAGDRIYVRNEAIRQASPEVTAKLMRGEPVCRLGHPQPFRLAHSQGAVQGCGDACRIYSAVERCALLESDLQIAFAAHQDRRSGRPAFEDRHR